MKQYLILAHLLLTALVFACSSDSDSGNPVRPDPDFPQAADYFLISDTSQIMVMEFSDSHDTCEPFVNWEEIIGEPYTDLNGNGVYDNGIDGFRRTSDPALNQDLNYNGRHDGPENLSPYQWESAIPLDDLDGNGTIRFPDEPISPDCAYAPFVDWNGNGGWDSVANSGNILGRWNSFGDSLAIVMEFESGIDSSYYFLSDSGKPYWFVGSQQPFRLRMERLFGWNYYFANNGLYVRLTDSTLVQIRESEEIATESGTGIKRHIRFIDEFEIGSETFTNVFHIRFDSADMRYGADERLRNASWDLYFVKDVGLIKADIRYNSSEGMRELHYLIYKKFTSAFPLPLTKVDRPQ